jgi:DNA topoisomerase III
VIFQEEKEEDILLPNVKEGEQGKVVNVTVKEGKTQAPKRYTEGQLITLMKTAGRFLENEELEKVLKKVEGLGTEATRAGIITMLKNRKYIDIKRNLVYATDKGKMIIEAIGHTLLSSAELTAKWEQRLSEIGEGQATPAEFMEQIKKLSSKIIQEATESADDWAFTGLNVTSVKSGYSKFTIGKKVGRCQLCDGDVIDKGKFYGCSNYKKTACSFTLSKYVLGKKLTEGNIKKLLNDGQTDVIKGFKSKDKTFNAKLKWINGKLEFQF